MARDFARPFYKSKTWQITRAAYIAYRCAIDGGLCETCRKRIGEIVHHVIWLTKENINNPDITLNFKNLKLDCWICHNKEKDKETKPGRFRYGKDGEILPPLDEA
jgi:5-methylcytosine-specific restriction endonuclease McrA